MLHVALSDSASLHSAVWKFAAFNFEDILTDTEGVFPIYLTCIYPRFQGSQECIAFGCFVAQNSINAKFFLGIANWYLVLVLLMAIRIGVAVHRIRVVNQKGKELGLPPSHLTTLKLLLIHQNLGENKMNIVIQEVKENMRQERTRENPLQPENIEESAVKEQSQQRRETM